jgi:hypothetical protein
LADILLPPENFGSKPSGPKKSTGMGRPVPQSSGFGLKTISHPRYEKGRLKLDFELDCGKKHDTFEIQLQVTSESGGIKAESWEDEEVIGREFPLKLDEIVIRKIRTGTQSPPFQPTELFIDESLSDSSYKNVRIVALRTPRFNIPYGIRLHISDKTGYKINGTVSISGMDDKVKGELILVQNEGEKE